MEKWKIVPAFFVPAFRSAFRSAFKKAEGKAGGKAGGKSWWENEKCASFFYASFSVSFRDGEAGKVRAPDMRTES